jgi:hypothetical protein
MTRLAAEVAQTSSTERQSAPEYQVQQQDNILLVLPPLAAGGPDLLKVVPKDWLATTLAERFPGQHTIFVIDSGVDEKITTETATFTVGHTKIGTKIELRQGNLAIVIDHHADLAELQKIISTEHFAAAIARLWRTPPALPMVITHLDADSLLSVLMANGQVPPELILECTAAVEAVDHTGAITDLGDLISAVQGENNLALSLRLVTSYLNFRRQNHQESLDTFLTTCGDQHITDALLAYREKRDEAGKYFKLGDQVVDRCDELDQAADQSDGIELATSTAGWHLRYLGNGVFFVDNEADPNCTYFDNELLPYLIPEPLKPRMKVILFSRQMPGQTQNEPLKYEVKARVAPSWVGKINLQSLGINRPPYNLGCRHNAGSTFRDGGTLLHGIALARVLQQALPR